MTDCFTIDTDNLLSKFGFGDGELFIPIKNTCYVNTYEYEDSLEQGRIGFRICDSESIIKIVKNFIIPNIINKIEYETISTIHNPIRVTTIDGNPIGKDSKLIPKSITINIDDFLNFIKKQRISLYD